jgi:hypothetical protein
MDHGFVDDRGLGAIAKREGEHGLGRFCRSQCAGHKVDRPAAGPEVIKAQNRDGMGKWIGEFVTMFERSTAHGDVMAQVVLGVFLADERRGWGGLAGASG